MKTRAGELSISLWFALITLSLNASAAIHYVDVNGANPVSPYTNWLTAATNIQDAVNAATTFGDIVLVTNGIYQYGGSSWNGSNRVVAGVTVQSVNGALVTVIKGYQVPGTTNGTGAIRCVYLKEFGRLYGFTLTNGATGIGGGALNTGGGIVMESQCIVSNCIITGNAAYSEGGGAYSGNNSLLVKCVINGNTLTYGGGSGGGVYGCSLANCILSNNWAANGGGMAGSSLNMATNCLLNGNGSTNSTSGGAAYLVTLMNCTLTGNFSKSLGAADGCTLVNSVIYGNSNNGYADCYQCRLTNCCTTLGTGNLTLSNNSISNNPTFMDPAHGDYHLIPGSPCIDVGTNIFALSGTDLDGNPRIVGVAVDMGAYENQNTNPVHYVDLTSTNPIAPYTNWLTAATNIQDAIDAATAGDFVVVTDGVYAVGGRTVNGYTITNRVVIDKALTVQSVNGPAATVIAGLPGTGAYFSIGYRCVYLTNGATLAGFTLTNGATITSGNSTNDQSGAAAWCEASSATLSDCVLTHSYANQYGGGAYQGTLNNCVISNTTAFLGGGGASHAILNNCIVTSNKLIQGSGGGGVAYGVLTNCQLTWNNGANGGGAYYSTLNNCVVSNNNASSFGGGVAYGVVSDSLISSNRAYSGGGTYQSTNYNCTITNNTGAGVYGGVAYNCVIAGNPARGINSGTAYNCWISGNAGGTGGGAISSTLYNCVLTGNTATYFTAAATGGGAQNSTLYNCTVANNVAGNAGGGTFNSQVYNSIVYDNTSLTGNSASNYYSGSLSNCCTVPADGLYRCFTNEPAFVDLANNDFRLQSNSPCINAGNNTYVTGTTDYNGNPRIVGGTVDVGAYEYQAPSSVLSYAWAQQFGLPTDGSADYLDSDGDGMNNRQEWIAGTDPTNAASVLALDSPAPTNNTLGITVTWQSVSNVTYYLDRSSDLSAQPAFSTIQSNIVGQPGTTSCTDTTATNAVPYFYRVGVR